MTSLYASEIGSHFSNPESDVTKLFPHATYAHLAGLFEVCNPRHRQQFLCVLRTKVRCDGNGLGRQCARTHHDLEFAVIQAA